MKKLKVLCLNLYFAVFISITCQAQITRAVIEMGVSSQFEKQTLTTSGGVGVSVLQSINENNAFRIDLLARSLDFRLCGTMKIGYQYKCLFGYGFHQVFNKKSSTEKRQSTYMGIGAAYNFKMGTDILQIGYEQSLEKYQFGNLGLFSFSILKPL
jgi:hypothetical protein